MNVFPACKFHEYRQLEHRQGLLIAVGLSLCITLICGCASSTTSSRQVADLPPLQLDGQQLGVAGVAQLAATPDLLGLDEDMREFVNRYTADSSSRRQRLINLHRAVNGSATLGIDYDPFAEGSASEAYHSQAANCLSYANLFVALAREARLDARYQWVEVRPQWTRMGERVAVRLHVNTVVHLNRNDRFMVDIDPLPSRDITGSQEITDQDAQALYHNNIAMDALSREDLEQAWLHGVRALQLSPAMSHLWVNLGAIYRRAGQHRAAESSYLYALELDDSDRSAMNNLMVLYGLEQREQERAYWAGKVDRYRDRNPYYHAWLGDQSGEEGDWRTALGHYKTAVDLQPEDGKLYFSIGLIYEQLQQHRAAQHYVQQALDHATLRRDRDRYRVKLEEINLRLLAVF